MSSKYPYPYPSHVHVPSFVTMKLSGRDMYGLWKTQMLCLLESHDMLDFILAETCPPQKEKLGDLWKGKEKKDENYMSWRRSDALVKGWILGSLSEQALRLVLDQLKTHNTDFRAKDVWDTLKTTYAPRPPLHQEDTSLRAAVPNEDKNQVKKEKIRVGTIEKIWKTVTQRWKNKQGDVKKNKQEDVAEDVAEERAKKQEDVKKKEAEERAKVHHKLYQATLTQDFENVKFILENERGISVIDPITINGNTALHVAVGTAKKKEFLEEMLKLAPDRILGLVNSEKSTLLHVAAIVGNLDAAKILVNKTPELLSCKDNVDSTPLTRASSNLNTETYLYLLEETARIISTVKEDTVKEDVCANRSGDELLVNAFSSRDFGSVRKLLEMCNNVNSPALLMAMAQNFPSEPTYWGRRKWIQALQTPINWPKYRPYDKIFKSQTQYVGAICRLFFAYARKWILLLYMAIFSIFVSSILKLVHMKDPNHDDALSLLSSVCYLIRNNKQTNSYHVYYTDPILEAARQNASEFIKEIVSYFPNAIWSLNEDGHDIIQLAVMHRSEKVYNLLYQMSEHKNIYRTIKDPLENNLLHLAARLAPANKLNLISGAPLQIQRELQWFEEVKGYVSPLNIIQKNSFGETPQMVFTREHKDLVIEGEKWMKATAKSYTITAALIATIMFAAAITVPGGSDQSNGIPIFRKTTAFKIFAISDAISLFTSVTSLLMFLSILTTRYAEGDFLFKLPTKLIIGLVNLFVSTTAMLIAFGATLFIVFGQSNKTVLTPIAILTCLPITSFVTLQFPLVADLIISTYGPNIFGQESNEPFY